MENQIPPEAYAAIGALVAANLPMLIKFFRDLFKKDADNAAQFVVLNSRLDQLTKDIGRLEKTVEKNTDDLNEAFRQLKGSRG